MQFIVKFNVDNAAFEEDRESQVSAILKEVADQVAGGNVGYIIKDVNGNKIGSAYYADEVKMQHLGQA